MELMVTELSRRGLPVHEVEPPQRRAKVLGWSIDSQGGTLRPSPERSWRLILATQGLLRGGTASSQVVARLVGHFTFAFLCHRPLLSIFNSTYRYIRALKGDGASLWPSMVRELGGRPR